MTITKNGHSSRSRNRIGNAQIISMTGPRISITMETPTIKEFGWADFPLLQQSLVPDSELPLSDGERNGDGKAPTGEGAKSPSCSAEAAAAATTTTSTTTNIIGGLCDGSRSANDVLGSLAASKSSTNVSEMVRKRRKSFKFSKSTSSASLSASNHGKKHSKRAARRRENESAASAALAAVTSVSVPGTAIAAAAAAATTAAMGSHPVSSMLESLNLKEGGS